MQTIYVYIHLKASIEYEYEETLQVTISDDPEGYLYFFGKFKYLISSFYKKSLNPSFF